MRTLGFYLPHSTFPADRGQLLCAARRSGAPDGVVRLLRRLADPPATYPDLDGVLAQLAEDGEAGPPR